MQSTGQASTQAVSLVPTHGSAITYVISSCLPGVPNSTELILFLSRREGSKQATVPSTAVTAQTNRTSVRTTCAASPLSVFASNRRAKTHCFMITGTERSPHCAYVEARNCQMPLISLVAPNRGPHLSHLT